LRVDSRT